jgi:hypothetical protein
LNSTNTVLETDPTNNVGQAPQPLVVVAPVIIDNGQPGYAETGSGWTDYPVGYNGGLRFHAPGSGANTASWQTTGLAAGYYTVQATWNAGSNHASNAPYSIYDGTTLLQTIIVNQQPGPSGVTVGGVVFQDLGTFQITSGTLRVVVSDNVNGYVVADAVRIVRIPALTVSGPVLVDNSQPGYSESGSPWVDYAVGYNGGLRYHAPGGGADTANWLVTGLPAGSYTVEVTWNASSNHASNAPYAIYDGNTLLTTVLVNQQLAPSGTTVGGVVFQTLATVQVNSGTLRVVLSDNVDGYVVADAVYVVQAAPGAQLASHVGSTMSFAPVGNETFSSVGGWHGGWPDMPKPRRPRHHTLETGRHGGVDTSVWGLSKSSAPWGAFDCSSSSPLDPALVHELFADWEGWVLSHRDGHHAAISHPRMNDPKS